jgi:hypothetical protein
LAHPTSTPNSPLQATVSPAATAPSNPVVTAVPTPGVQLPAPSAIVSKGKQRTQEMIGILKKAFVYSPSNIRRCVFVAIREMKATLQHKTVAQFLREVKDRAKAQADTAGINFSYWPTAMTAILEMLLFSESLVGPDGKPIKRGLQARGTILTAIAEDFETKCELFLLTFLIQHMQLTNKDRTSIAHALFKEGKAEKTHDQLEEQLDRLFTLLGDDLYESPDGFLILESETKQKAAAQIIH